MKINLFGASGHAKVIIDIIKSCDFQINFIFDDDLKVRDILDFNVVTTYDQKDLNSAPLVIGIGDNQLRKSIAQRLDCQFATALIHPSAVVSDCSILNEGTVVMPNAVINNSAQIGSHCIVNTGAIIEHDCRISDFVHISPQVALGGGVEVGEQTHIGLGASVIQNIRIGKNCMIGAGAVIIKDVPDGATVVGNPGKIIKFHN